MQRFMGLTKICNKPSALADKALVKHKQSTYSMRLRICSLFGSISRLNGDNCNNVNFADIVVPIRYTSRITASSADM